MLCKTIFIALINENEIYYHYFSYKIKYNDLMTYKNIGHQIHSSFKKNCMKKNLQQDSKMFETSVRPDETD
jgi:hypothetical protein